MTFEHPFYPDQGCHPDHEHFLRCLMGFTRIELLFFSQEDEGQLRRSCAPMDFGPSRRSWECSNRYHFWDFDSDEAPWNYMMATAMIYALPPIAIFYALRRYIAAGLMMRDQLVSRAATLTLLPTR
jgi:hypothetical protein